MTTILIVIESETIIDNRYFLPTTVIGIFLSRAEYAYYHTKKCLLPLRYKVLYYYASVLGMSRSLILHPRCWVPSRAGLGAIEGYLASVGRKIVIITVTVKSPSILLPAAQSFTVSQHYNIVKSPSSCCCCFYTKTILLIFGDTKIHIADNTFRWFQREFISIIQLAIKSTKVK